MKLTRRDFIHAGCAAGAVTLSSIANKASAQMQGRPIGNPNRITMNAVCTYANLAKGINWRIIDPSITDSNGYPQGKLVDTINANAWFDPNYFGDYVWKWSGTGSMWLNANLIIRNTQVKGVQTGRVINNVPGTRGAVTQLHAGAIIDTKDTPRVVFAFGLLIKSMSDSGVSNGVGGTYIKITFDLNTGISGSRIKIQNQIGQAAATGIWNWTTNGISDGKSIVLTTDLKTGAPSVYDASDPWIRGGEGIYPGVNLSVALGGLSPKTFRNFTDLVFCKDATPSGYSQTYEQLIASGVINDPDYVVQLKYLFNHASAPFSNAGWLRFLDLDGERGYQSDTALRIPASALSYANSNGSYFTPRATTGTYWGGSVTTPDGTNFAVPNPSGRATGAYADLETVQGKFSLTSPTTNTSPLPTLSVGSRGAAPIFTEGLCASQRIVCPAAPGGTGSTYAFTFGASWLNSGKSYTFTYNSQAGDTTVNNFLTNLAAAMTADSVIGTSVTKINFVLSGDLFIYSRHANAGALTVTYTSGPAAITMTRVTASSFTTGDYTTFVYSATLGGWIWLGNNAGMVMSVPWEQIVELCNVVGAHCWINWPLYTKAQYITDQTSFFGDATTGLRNGLRFGTETANEVWNFSSPGPYAQSLYLGSSLGLPYPSEGCVWGYTALKCMQYASLSQSAWKGKGRSLSDHYIFLIGRSAEAGIGQNFDTSALKGTYLTTSNAVYNAYSGLSVGVAAADYSSYPNRPVDNVSASGMATYWWSGFIGEIASEIGGTVAANATWLQAAKDYSKGLTASAFSALVTINLATRGPGNRGQSLGNFGTSQFRGFEAMIAQYDAGRASRTSGPLQPTGALPKLGNLHYEGGPQWSFSSNAINGTNSVNDSTSLTALHNQITNLGWNVSAYTLSGDNSASEMAQMIINMTQGWKFDLAGLSPKNSGTAANTSSYDSMIKNSYYRSLKSASASSGREVKPAQYGFQGSTWGLFPVTFQLGSPYQSYNAIHEWNAGS